VSEDKFVFKPCIPPGTGASGPVNAFGQHNFIVLRFVAGEGHCSEPEINHSLTLSNARIAEVLKKLVADKYLLEECGGFSITPEGKAVLEKL
jgi:predicted transcriptional regulator